MNTKKNFFIYSILLGLFLFACSDKVIEKPFISTPFPQLNQTATDFSFDAEKGDTLLFSSGSRIIVPADSWVDSAGNKITGNVTIKYREFSDAGEVFLAGIPLAYDTAGRSETLVTAGMFEIRSYKGNQEIFIGQNQKLTVQMASNESTNDYNFYYLDEAGKNWQYVGTAPPSVNPAIQQIKDTIETLKPDLPFPFDNSYFALNYNAIFDIYYNENYDKIYQNYKSKLPKSKAEQYGLTWSGIFGRQQLFFNKGRYEAYQMVWQNLGASLPRIAKECYVETLTHLGNNVYSMKLRDDKKTAIIRVKAIIPIKHLFAFTPETWKNKYDEVMAKIKKEEERLAMQFEVYRSFDISATGFHNWDKVYQRKDKIVVKGTFNFDKEIEGNLADLEIYYFIENNKSFVKIPYSASDSLMLVPDSTAKFIAVLSEKEAAVFSSSDYNKINFDKLKSASKPTYSFDMKTVGINSKEDFDKLLIIK